MLETILKYSDGEKHPASGTGSGTVSSRMVAGTPILALSWTSGTHRRGVDPHTGVPTQPLGGRRVERRERGGRRREVGVAEAGGGGGAWGRRLMGGDTRVGGPAVGHHAPRLDLAGGGRPVSKPCPSGHAATRVGQASPVAAAGEEDERGRRTSDGGALATRRRGMGKMRCDRLGRREKGRGKKERKKRVEQKKKGKRKNRKGGKRK